MQIFILAIIKNDCMFQQSSLAEDMGLEEVRSIQMLKVQGGKAPSTFVPSSVPKVRSSDVRT